MYRTVLCVFLLQAVSDNAARREQEALAAQRRAQREAEDKKKGGQFAGKGKGYVEFPEYPPVVVILVVLQVVRSSWKKYRDAC